MSNWYSIAIILVQFVATIVMAKLFGFIGLVSMLVMIAVYGVFKKIKSGDWSVSPRRNCIKILDGAHRYVYRKYGDTMTCEQGKEVDETIEKYKKIVEKVVFV